ncbi:MAG: S41 family peptidase [Holosporales bacterium]|jgi:carboxyl-terminal processing protease|nr:S41 family peptidase [Holosporales bacterium]
MKRELFVPKTKRLQMACISRQIFIVVATALSIVSCKKENRTASYLVNMIGTDSLINGVIDEIENSYADEVSREKLEIGAINGILGVIDEHSTYISQDEFDAFNKSARGTFLGIGVEIKQVKDGIEISSVIDGGPAANAGLKVADVITHIDGADVLQISMKEVVSRLSSDYAMKITVSVLRNKTEKLKFKLRKSVIQITSVKLDFIDDIAYIKINHFNDGTINATLQSIKKLKQRKAAGVIIDLRNNPGGILAQAIGVCDMFLSNKKIVEFKTRNAEESRVLMSDEKDILDGLPMAVLIDSNTASGGELVAAALGENKRAVLLGEKTYGKGSLQTVIPIPGKGAIKLTTAYFVSPNGNIINQAGVIPDIEILRDTDQKGTQEQTDTKIQDPWKAPIILRAMDLLHGLATIKDSAVESSTGDGQ